MLLRCSTIAWLQVQQVAVWHGPSWSK